MALHHVREERPLDDLAAVARHDAEARALLIERLLPLLRRMARRYAGGAVSLEDLQQEAVVGALRALDRYDAARGPFLAWLRLWVRHSLQLAVAEQARAVRFPTHVLWEMHDVKEARERFARRERRQPRLVELADELGWSVDRLGHVLRVEAPGESLDELERIEHPLAYDAYEDVLNRLAARQVAPLLGRLSDREREVLDRRLAGESLRQLGRSLGVSQERVRQIEERALGKLRQAARVGRSDAPPARERR